MSEESISERYITLVREITKLQWVRESIASHSKNYESLKKKMEKQLRLKEFSEKELNKCRMAKDYPNTSTTRNSYTSAVRNLNQVTNSVTFYENAVKQLQLQIDEAKAMMHELSVEKDKLNELCNQLHLFYNQIVIPGTEDIFEQHLQRDVKQLEIKIPEMESNIKLCKTAQSKLYEAIELMNLAMKSLPGASTFLDRQAIATNDKNVISSFYANVKSITTKSPAKKISEHAYQLVKEASDLRPNDVPNISNSTQYDDIPRLLTDYRGYRLKIESILRKQLNPRLNNLENQLVMAKYHFEQKTVEWIDRQITFLESYLRDNGLLENQNLDREISMLRMGSRAAVAAVAEEVNDRVTVDDALNISADDNGALPEYEYNNGFLLHNNDHPPPAYTR